MSKQTYRNKSRKSKKSPVLIIALLVLGFFALKGAAGLIMGTGIPPAPQRQTTPRPEITPEPTPEPQKQIPQPNEYCTLVNRKNPLTADFQVETRRIVNNGTATDYMFDVRVADRLEAMLKAAVDAGYPVLIRSAHRTINYQQMLYSNKVNAYLNAGYAQAAAEAEAAKWVAPPGTSEHNLGIVTDIVNKGYTGELEQYFDQNPLFTWLVENCADYGFILRYPKGKESVTGIVYEPWHYRYVGEEVARYIMENNLTLEEYWEEVKNG